MQHGDLERFEVRPGVHLRSQIVKLSEQRSPSAEKETVLSEVLSALEAVMMKRHLHRLRAVK